MPEIVAHGIRIKDPETLFGEYQVSEFDLARYRKLIADGLYEEAVDDFAKKYMVDYAELYNATMVDYLRQAQEGQLSKDDSSALLLSIAALSAATQTVLNKNFQSFVQTLAPEVFSDLGIKSPDVKAIILKTTLQRFQELTASAMTETSNNVLSQIRAMQTAMIVENQKISALDIVGQLLKSEVSGFKSGLRKRFPEYYEAMEMGNILKSRRFGPQGQRVIRYTLSDYAEMATRTTLLNVDRIAVEVSAGVAGDKVVQYYLRDHRELKSGKEREICKELLSGSGLLALDQETADALGIPTIDEARAQGAMGPYCRHSIRTARQAVEAVA